MAKTRTSVKPLFLFALFFVTLGSGFVLLNVANQQSTELRSRAAGQPYSFPTPKCTVQGGLIPPGGTCCDPNPQKPTCRCPAGQTLVFTMCGASRCRTCQ